MTKDTMSNPAAALVYPVTAQEINFDIATLEPASPASFSTWIRVLMRNWQQGTVASKGRSDVARTNRKPWKQKGTGRARAGSARSPLWKGGGVIFGPQARVCTLKMPKKSRKKIMSTLLAQFLDNKRIICADWSIASDKPKTAEAQCLLNSGGLSSRKIILFVAPNDYQTALSFANIPNVYPLSFDQPNAYELANSDCWLFLKKDIDQLKEMVSQWR